MNTLTPNGRVLLAPILSIIQELPLEIEITPAAF